MHHNLLALWKCPPILHQNLPIQYLCIDFLVHQSDFEVNTTIMAGMEKRIVTTTELIYEKRSGAAWLRLNRPNELNTLSPSLIASLNDALDEIEADQEVISVVITGTGRGFCAGADLKFLNKLPAAERHAQTAIFVKTASDLVRRIELLPKPVIAAVNGIAAGGGMELVLACDLVFACRSARLGDAHANFAQFPGAGSTVRLPRKIGPTMAKRLFFTGELLMAEAFLHTGLLTALVADADLASEVEAITTRIGTKSPLYLARIKRAADEAMHMPIDIGLAVEVAMNGYHATSHDCAEGMAAFNEKRTPIYRGR